MKKMVVVKYLGIPLERNDKGEAIRMIDPYSNGTVKLRIGEVSQPIEPTMALQLQHDFGMEAFAIERIVEVPETDKEDAAINNLIEGTDGLPPVTKTPKLKKDVDDKKKEEQKKKVVADIASIIPKIQVKRRRKSTAPKKTKKSKRKHPRKG